MLQLRVHSALLKYMTHSRCSHSRNSYWPLSVAYEDGKAVSDKLSPCMINIVSAEIDFMWTPHTQITFQY